jgi:WD40 repeat protein
MFAHRLAIAAALLVPATLPDGAFSSEPAKSVRTAKASDGPRLDRYGDPLPPGALARLGTVRYRFEGMGILPDGETVVSASGTSIQLWDARTGALKREIETGFYGISSGCCLSGDGRTLALTGLISYTPKQGWQGGVLVYDLVSGKMIQTFTGQTGSARDIALTPDGKLLMILSGEGKLTLHELPSGIEILSHRLPRSGESQLALSSDGSTLAIAGGDNNPNVLVWHWQSAEEPRTLRVGGYGANKVALSHDGKLVATCDQVEPTVSVVDVRSGRLLYKLESGGHDRCIYFAIAFAPDGHTLAARGIENERGAVHLWDLSSGKFRGELKTLRGSPRSWALAFSPSGRLLVSGRQVWDLAGSRELSANEQAHREAITRIVASVNGVVATASDDHTIRSWDLASGRQLQRFDHRHWVRDIAVSPNGTKLASNSLDDSVCLWDLGTGKRIYKLPGHGASGGKRAVAFTPDGTSFLSWGDDMDVRKWDVRTGKALAEYSIRPSGVRVVSDDDEPDRRNAFETIMNAASAGIFTRDASQFIVEYRDKAFVFDTASGKQLRQLPIATENSSAISPDGRTLLASVRGKVSTPASVSGQTALPASHLVCLWELASGKPLNEIHVPEERAGPVAFSTDGKLFAAASSRPGEHIRVWNSSRQEQWEVHGFGGTVRSLAFMPDAKRLISGMDDGSALVWDLSQRP